MNLYVVTLIKNFQAITVILKGSSIAGVSMLAANQYQET